YDDEGSVEEEKRDTIEIIKDVYSEHYRSYQGDIIICRQTLEHIYDPKHFLHTIRRAIDDPLKTKVFFEVPNAINIFRRLFVWDIIYEHYSYFTPTSLVALFSACGFTVNTLTEEFEGQYLCVDASLQTLNAHNQNRLKNINKFKPINRDIVSFAVNYQRKLNTCNQKLEEINRKGQRAVVWGGGSKGVTFLNQINNPQQIKYVVDINPRKQGLYVPGTGQLIVSPAFLSEYNAEIVIVMNPIYTNEIRHLSKNLGVTADFILVTT
ncbi:MAG: methyltransferase domain-containing protein, partial [Candidatus Bathyarchaeota archaeon]